MITIVCCDKKCGVAFGLPEHIYNQARNEPSRWFQCPNGHEQHYTESEAERLKRRVADLEIKLAESQSQRLRNWRTANYWKGIAHRKARP